jgi:ABC-2 type transport system permease protein
MVAIFRREMKSYFTSPIGFIFLAGFYLVSGFLFWQINLVNSITDVSYLFSDVTITLVVLIPILTMRLFSEEKKQKTDQLLLTSPVSLTGMVIGKFLSALAVFATGLAVTLVYGLTMAVYVNIDGAVIFTNILGMLLLGAALIGIGMFISSMTENQVVAIFASFIVILMLFIVQSLSSVLTSAVWQSIISAIAVQSRYNNFAAGIFNLGDAVYYLSIAVVFIFLTVRMLEKRRWS